MTKEEFNAAAKVAEIYFNIAADAIGEDEVRRKRDLILDNKTNAQSIFKAKDEIVTLKTSLSGQLKRGVINQDQYDAIMNFLEMEERRKNR